MNTGIYVPMYIHVYDNVVCGYNKMLVEFHNILTYTLLRSLGLKLTEVAHDYQPSIRKYIVEELKCLNS